MEGVFLGLCQICVEDDLRSPLEARAESALDDSGIPPPRRKGGG